MSQQPLCGLCGNPMPEGEEMFKYHGYSGDCPPKADTKGNDMAAPEPLANTEPDESAQATIEDKLYDTIHTLLRPYNVKMHVIDDIQAIITTEATKAREEGVMLAVKTHQEQYPDCPPKLQKEQP